MAKHVVTYIEYGEGVDGRSRALGIYDTKAEAEAAIENDMNTYASSLKTPFYDDWCVWRCPEDAWVQGCAWNISEIEL